MPASEDDATSCEVRPPTRRPILIPDRFTIRLFAVLAVICLVALVALRLPQIDAAPDDLFLNGPD